MGSLVCTMLQVTTSLLLLTLCLQAVVKGRESPYGKSQGFSTPECSPTCNFRKRSPPTFTKVLEPGMEFYQRLMKYSSRISRDRRGWTEVSSICNLQGSFNQGCLNLHA